MKHEDLEAIRADRRKERAEQDAAKKAVREAKRVSATNSGVTNRRGAN